MHKGSIFSDFMVVKNTFQRCLRRLRKFRALSWKMRVLILGSFWLMGIIRLTILIVPFRYLTRLMGKKMTESPDVINPKLLTKALKVGWAVNKTSNFTPWESKCLVCALTAQIILRFFKIPSTLYLGLAKEEKTLLAHAWLRCGSLIITGARERGVFTSVVQFAMLSQ